MLIWGATYRIAHKPGSQRKQRWVPVQRVVTRDSQRLAEAHWIANRREAFTRLVQTDKNRQFSEMSMAARPLSRHAWTPGRDKAMKRKHSREITM